MKWHNLILNQCPQCWKQLIPKPELSMATCRCGFAITFKRMQELSEKFAKERAEERPEIGGSYSENDDLF